MSITWKYSNSGKDLTHERREGNQTDVKEPSDTNTGHAPLPLLMTMKLIIIFKVRLICTINDNVLLDVTIHL